MAAVKGGTIRELASFGWEALRRSPSKSNVNGPPSSTEITRLLVM